MSESAVREILEKQLQLLSKYSEAGVSDIHELATAAQAMLAIADRLRQMGYVS